ncbi:MAG TPA: serine/threonine-protein kinase [Thermoguttaceae bacterium]|nr:serine/threonine-protein kinase [Thermoguttaceae bacterium]
MSDHVTSSSYDQTRPPDVPDFELLRSVGEGGFGRVWLGRNQTTGRLRAVKLIPLRGGGRVDPAGREIASLTYLEGRVGTEHPNLLAIHHVGKTADHLFYVMDLADDASGIADPSDPSYRPATLESRLESGPLAPEACLRRARELLAGLACLHAAGMVHRDVKPSNCLFVDGQLKLADFGLLTEADRQASRVGTRLYMPPDGRMDTRADVYAAGLVIYEMVTGLPADRFPCLVGERVRQIGDNPALARLNRLVLRACQPDPDQRFRDAGHMLAGLETAERPTATGRSRSRRRIAVSVACLVVALVAVAWALWPTPPEQAHVDPARAGPPERVHVNFVTEPFEATISLDGKLLLTPDGTPYRTPCTVPDLPARVHHAVLKREGLADQEVGPVDFAQTREIVVRWEREPSRDEGGDLPGPN